MNIFLLDENHSKNVEYYVDAHVVKQILETAQLLCTARRLRGDLNAEYRATHINHPCSLWVRQSSKNYEWLCELGMAMSEEYAYRYGKEHKSSYVILDCYNSVPNIPGEFTTPVSCMDDKYIVSKDPVENYRNYYINDKVFDKNGRLMAKWTKRNRPDWFVDKYNVLGNN